MQIKRQMCIRDRCESQCTHLKAGHEAVAIGYLERFAADYERESGQISVPEVSIQKLATITRVQHIALSIAVITVCQPACLTKLIVIIS